MVSSSNEFVLSSLDVIMEDNPKEEVAIERCRKLLDECQVFSQNAWDDTVWSSEMRWEAEKKVQKQREEASHQKNHFQRIAAIEQSSAHNWDQFYKTHEDKFFKDRSWIFHEFRELSRCVKQDSPPCNILEVGCGVGNAVSYLLKTNSNPNLHVYACDISEQGLESFRARDIYQKERDKLTIFQADVSREFNTKVLAHVEENSIDYLMMIFTLSAIKPDLMESTIKNLSRLLKPNGMILFRDYGRHDLTQLRFKGEAYLSDNYYVRADGTTSFFFTNSMIRDLFTDANLVEVQLKDDRRMLVNRAKEVVMRRCWLQAKFKKPADDL